MRFMILVKASQDSEAGKMPSQDMLTAMTTFNEELANAGVLLAGEGLHPSSRAKRVPFHEGEIEIRQVFEAADFGAEFTPELQAREERLRAQAAPRAQGAD